jgi:hypothetical protein
MLGKAAFQTLEAGHSSSLWTLHPAGADLAARGEDAQQLAAGKKQRPLHSEESDGHSRTGSSCVALITKYHRPENQVPPDETILYGS